MALAGTAPWKLSGKVSLIEQNMSVRTYVGIALDDGRLFPRGSDRRVRHVTRWEGGKSPEAIRRFGLHSPHVY
jgi:hypothetical protein